MFAYLSKQLICSKQVEDRKYHLSDYLRIIFGFQNMPIMPQFDLIWSGAKCQAGDVERGQGYEIIKICVS